MVDVKFSWDGVQHVDQNVTRFMNTLALPFIVESLEIMNFTHPDIASIESTYADTQIKEMSRPT